mgnify:CR=1 FL=1
MVIGLALGAERPVLRVDVPFPTKDKPQSKVWHAHGQWWAWLPVKDGSSVWRRTPGAGWKREAHLDGALRGLPGQADVWSDADGARAVLVGAKEVAVVALRWEGGRYVVEGAPVRWAQEAETATIVRDREGRWWIAHDDGNRIVARGSVDRDGRKWREPVVLNEKEMADDDICAAIALPDGVGVLWSDQKNDGVYFRRIGGAVEVVQEGGLNADDHINAAVSADGTVYVAMKNSVDRVGEPQLVLRIRDRQGWWTSVPYANRTAEGTPSRPIAVIGGAPERLFLLHTFYEPGPTAARRDGIALLVSGLPRYRVDVGAEVVTRGEGVRLNDVTGPKGRFPEGAEWVVLSSDEHGNVYETRLEKRF